MKIRNIVFDMGGVLIKWDPAYYVRRLGLKDAADNALLLRHTYGSPVWQQMDWGTANEIDVYNYACTQLPERLHDAAHALVFDWINPLELIDGMEELVRQFKAMGYGVYLLSNASFRQKEYWPRIPESEVFDGRVVSAEVGVVKPHAAIYEKLLKTYDLQPETCVFIDDMPINVVGAINAGMHGIMFDGDVERLRRILKLMLVEIGE